MNENKDIILSFEDFEGGYKITPDYFNHDILMNIWTSWAGWYWDPENSQPTEKEEKKEKKEDAWCEHDWVNVSFVHIKLVCKKCNKDKP